MVQTPRTVSKGSPDGISEAFRYLGSAPCASRHGTQAPLPADAPVSCPRSVCPSFRRLPPPLSPVPSIASLAAANPSRWCSPNSVSGPSTHSLGPTCRGATAPVRPLVGGLGRPRSPVWYFTRGRRSVPDPAAARVNATTSEGHPGHHASSRSVRCQGASRDGRKPQVARGSVVAVRGQRVLTSECGKFGRNNQRGINNSAPITQSPQPAR